ncbi:MAG: dTMP kinase [Bullifex sp.]
MNETILKDFIVFEGLDGSGKSSQARALRDFFEKAGRPVRLSAEPSGRPIGALVRDVLRNKISATPRALALLYAADREDHLNSPEDGIVRGTENGIIEISDRYFYSSLAYQGVSVDEDFVRRINDFPSPEFLIYVDAPVDVCMKRIDSRGEEKELFEKKSYLEKVRERFENIFSNLPSGVKFLKVDGNLPIDEITGIITDFVSSNG